MGKQKASALIDLEHDADEIYNRVDTEGRPRTKKDYQMLLVLLEHLTTWQKRVRASQIASKFRKHTIRVTLNLFPWQDSHRCNYCITAETFSLKTYFLDCRLHAVRFCVNDFHINYRIP